MLRKGHKNIKVMTSTADRIYSAEFIAAASQKLLDHINWKEVQ